MAFINCSSVVFENSISLAPTPVLYEHIDFSEDIYFSACVSKVGDNNAVLCGNINHTHRRHTVMCKLNLRCISYSALWPTIGVLL